MYRFNVQKVSKHLMDCCTFDDVTDGTVETDLERMKSQPMLQTNVRRNDIDYARKNEKFFVYYRESMHKKEKILQIHAGFWQGQ